MGGTGSFPIDLVLFAMIAAFLVLRLRSILGRRTGYERPPQPVAPTAAPRTGGTVIDGTAEPVQPAAASRPLPDPASPTGQALARMRQIDPAFDPARFLTGAEAAFRMIVTAFARADRAALRPLLTDDTYRSFEGAIAAREQAGEVQRTDIRAIDKAEIEAAAVSGTIGSITVRFVSDQVSETLDRDGRHVAGSDAVTEITDLWTFERDLSNADPAWRLAATRSG